MIDKFRTVVVGSYYIIRVNDNKQDKYVVDGFNGKLMKYTTNEKKAKKFEHFGLKEMERSLKRVIKHVSAFNLRGIENITVVGEDVTMKVSDIKDMWAWNSFFVWDKVIDDKVLDYMVDLSKTEDIDGEETENYVSVHKFLSHVRGLDYTVISKLAIKWKTFSYKDQASLAVRYAGEYHASRFMMFMEYVTLKLGFVESNPPVNKEN